jgi:hypothetical protein
VGITMRRFVLLLLSVMIPACAVETGDDASDSTEDELRKGSAEQWIYDGPLPHLATATITVSLQAHTARVTGHLPRGFDKLLPPYVEKTEQSDGTVITVVYPIATGESVAAQGTHYTITRASPWVPTNDHATWGGFPFIPYDGGIAFHGPITYADGQWKLIRGPVSHGCNRMQGEHVVELANLIGVNMTTKVWTGQSATGLHVPVTVLHDRPDTWRGKSVDVDFPADPRVVRPKGNVKMFKTWSADQHPNFVCALDRSAVGSTVPVGYCAHRVR